MQFFLSVETEIYGVNDKMILEIIFKLNKEYGWTKMSFKFQSNYCYNLL